MRKRGDYLLRTLALKCKALLIIARYTGVRTMLNKFFVVLIVIIFGVAHADY